LVCGCQSTVRALAAGWAPWPGLGTGDTPCRRATTLGASLSEVHVCLGVGPGAVCPVAVGISGVAVACPYVFCTLAVQIMGCFRAVCA